MSQQRVSLREFLQVQIHAVELRLVERIEALENLVMARLAAMQLAIDLAAAALNGRLETMNEIRGQLATQRSEFVTIERLDAFMAVSQSDKKALDDKLDALEVQVNNQATLTRDQHQKDLDTLRDRMEIGLRSANTDIRSLRESRSAGAGLQTGARELVPWLALAFSLGCSGVTLGLTIIGMLGGLALFLITHK